MDKYIYLLLGVMFVAPVIIISLARKDLQKISIRLLIPGGIAGLVAEYWYFQDYWRPPSILGTAKLSIEDFLFGVGVTCLGSIIYKYVGKVKHAENYLYPQRYGLFGIFFASGVIGMIIFNGLLNVNSIIVSSVAFIFFASLMICARRDLLVPSLSAGLLLVLFTILVYFPLFNWLSPSYWDNYWLLNDTFYGIKILGNIPLTELLWYFSWGTLSGIAYEFVTGKALEKR